MGQCITLSADEDGSTSGSSEMYSRNKDGIKTVFQICNFAVLPVIITTRPTILPCDYSIVYYILKHID